MLEAFDADEGLSAIQGFFSIPAPPANFNPTAALNNFFTITEGSVCLLHPYLVHPIIVKGLKPPNSSNCCPGHLIHLTQSIICNHMYNME